MINNSSTTTTNAVSSPAPSYAAVLAANTRTKKETPLERNIASSSQQQKTISQQQQETQPTHSNTFKSSKKSTTKQGQKSTKNTKEDEVPVIAPMEYPQQGPVDPCNVFIKYLPQFVDDQELRNLFQNFGKILTCKVMVDQQTKKTLGYGFVRFSSPQEAQTAIQSMNGFKVEKKTLLCKLSNITYPTQQVSSPSTFPSTTSSSSSADVKQQVDQTNTTVYIKNLPTRVEEEFRKMFEGFGNMEEVKLFFDKKNNTFKNSGTIRYSTHSEALNAIQEMNGKSFVQGEKLQVKFSEPTITSPHQHVSFQHAMTNFLPPHTTILQHPQQQQQQQHLHQNYYTNYATYMATTASGQPVIPYPQMEDILEQQQQQALEQYYASMKLNTQQQLDGNGGSWSFSQHPTPAMNMLDQDGNDYSKNANPNLFVFHLPSTVQDEDLGSLFSQFGPLESYKVIRDRMTGESRGYGFVKYAKLEDAIMAISTMNGFQIGHKHLKVSFKTETPQYQIPTLSNRYYYQQQTMENFELSQLPQEEEEEELEEEEFQQQQQQQPQIQYKVLTKQRNKSTEPISSPQQQ